MEALPSKPIFTYSQETWSRPGGTPMHRETGYFRINPKRESGLDLLMVQGSGITEVEEGALMKPGCVELKVSLLLYACCTAPLWDVLFGVLIKERGCFSDRAMPICHGALE